MTNLASRFLVMVAVAGVLTTAATAAEQAIVVSFSSARPDGLPEGFLTELTGKGKPGQWSVNQDPSAPDGRVLVQTRTDTTDYRFPLAIYQGVTLANLDVTVRFKAVSGKIDRAGGIAVRLLDNNNYYVLRANALEDNVNLYRVVKGVRREIHGVSRRVSSGEWHTLGLRAAGNRLTASFDGKQLFTTQDETFSAAGRVALWTKADSVTQFDQLTITQLR